MERMDKFRSVDEAIDFAIAREQEAHDFYRELATRGESTSMSAVFREFAAEELGHKARLESIKGNKRLVPAKKQPVDLMISDYVIDVEPAAATDYQSALILAMKREKAAFKMYSDLAAAATDERLRKAFLRLAEEEAKHKLRFEIEYDEKILAEN